MRLRKKPWANQVLAQAETSNLLITNPSAYKGRWRSLGDFEKVVLEIGAGKGDYWLNLAKEDPTTLVIAIERMTDVAVIALKKALVSDIGDNHRFIIANSDAITEYFAESELSRIHLNFSDPWPKNHQQKRRLTYPSRLAIYEKLLENNGEIIQKTDNRSFFYDSIGYFEENHWQLIDRNDDFRQVENDDPITEYEQRFMDLNQPIYRAVWRRNNV